MGRDKTKGDIQAHIRKKSMRMKTVNRHHDTVLRNKLDTLDRLAVVKLEGHLKSTKQVAETLKTCNKTTGFSKNGLKPEREDVHGCLVDLKTMTHPWTYFGKYTIDSWNDNAVSAGIRSNSSSPSATPRSKISASNHLVDANHDLGLGLPIRPSTVAHRPMTSSLYSESKPNGEQLQRPKTSGSVPNSKQKLGSENIFQRPKTTGTNKRLLLRRSAKIHTIPEDKTCKTVSWAWSENPGHKNSSQSVRIDCSPSTKGVKQIPSRSIDLPPVNGQSQIPTCTQMHSNDSNDLGNGEPDSIMDFGTGSEVDPKADLKPDSKPDFKSTHQTDLKSDSKPDPKGTHQTDLTPDSKPYSKDTSQTDLKPDPEPQPYPKPIEVDALRPNPIRRLTLTPRAPQRKVETPRLLTLIDPSFYDDDPARVFTPKMIRPDRPKFHVRPQDRHKSEDMFLMRRYTLLQRQMTSDAPPMSEKKMQITVSFSHSARKKALDKMIEDNTQRRHEEKRQIQQSDIQTRVDGFLDALKEFVKQNNTSQLDQQNHHHQHLHQQQKQQLTEQQTQQH